MPARPISSKRASQSAVPIVAVLCVRVSSKEQGEEGFSLQAQLRLLRDYAAGNRIFIAHEFADVESSKNAGRAGFKEMVAYLKRHHATCKTILVEKTDRLYRNIKDWATLDELGVTIHFVKENVVIGPDSRSAEQFVHGIKVLVARNYSQNLGEETTKGMLEKARAGIYPSYAPVGYRNADGPNGKRIIVPDSEDAPVIADLFERFGTGKYSLDSLVVELRGKGVTLRGRKIHKSTLHQILRKRLYMGQFDWDRVTYEGTHEPLVGRECWGRVQQLLNDRAETKVRTVTHSFAYKGLVRCGHCGCLLVGEIKKGRYVYYHCTGNRGKCPEPYTPEKSLASAFAGILRELVIPEPVLVWLSEAVLESGRTEQAAREMTVKRLQARYNNLQGRIETMYIDKIEGRINTECFDKLATEWRSEQSRLLREIHRIESLAPAPVDQALDMLQLTSRASDLFLQQTGIEQRRLLQVVIDKASWQEGTLRTSLFEPFEVLRHSNRESLRKENENPAAGPDLGVWLLT